MHVWKNSYFAIAILVGAIIGLSSARPAWAQDKSLTSLSSWVTTSACGTSAHIIAA